MVTSTKTVPSHSRRFSFVNVPDPEKIDAQFIYNFFTTDERENFDGNPRAKGALSKDAVQKLLNSNTLSIYVPRLVKITFNPGNIVQFNNLGQARNFVEEEIFTYDKISHEESITNESFLAIRESDFNCKERASQKLSALSKALGFSFENSDQSRVLSEVLGIQKSDLLPLISPYSGDVQVNLQSFSKIEDLYEIAGKNSINSLLNKRIADLASHGANDVSPLSSISVKDQMQQISKTFLASCEDGSITQGDVEPQFDPFNIEDVDADARQELLGANLVGYVLVRNQHGTDGAQIGNSKIWTILGKENTTFLDSEIIYGSKYSYAVRNVYRIDAIVDVVDGDARQLKKISCLIASKPSTTATVLTEENEAPKSPDGVFYNFNYDQEKGLIITWQIPSGRSKDVKYFQVFKRHSIYEPFTCIAELDFDDSNIRTSKQETVREDLIFASKPGMPITYFEDKKFTRESKPAIYAICAIDAHGLTSGYSTQTQVGFNKIKNVLTLKNISRPDAPKQYPNFFIDPDLDDNIAVDSFTQDAIFDSGHTRFDVYFTPDAMKANSQDGNSINVFATNATYSMHVINLDLQKSDTATISIQDLRTKT